MSVNKVILVGNIGADAEVRTVGQNQVAKFRLATTEKYTKQDGTPVENTEWHTIELWGSAGVHPFLVKGQQIYVEGSIRTEQWTGNDGNTRYTTKIKASSVQLLGQRQAEKSAPAPQAQKPETKRHLPLPEADGDLPF
jgi:single-strand DNA-binding protein